MFARICERFRQGKDVSAADFVAGWQQLERYRAAFKNLVKVLMRCFARLRQYYRPHWRDYLVMMIIMSQKTAVTALYSDRQFNGDMRCDVANGTSQLWGMLLAGAFEEKRLCGLHWGRNGH